MKGVIHEAIFTSGGSSIHVDACEKSSIEAELVVFKEFISDVSLNEKEKLLKNQQQRVSQEFFIGCREVTGITDEQDISFCIEIMNETDQYINERDLLPSSCFRSIIRNIEKERPNSDGLIMTLSQTDSDTINIVGCGMNETE
ncbi:MAG: hypothetical protein EZS28_051335, partial [Streblomastix strix]